MKSPKILLLDIETSPIISYVWDLYNQNVGLNQIKQDSFIIAWAAKWFEKDKIYYMDQRNAKNIEDESKILKPIWELMNEADVILGQNSDKFDLKRLNTRFLVHGFKTPSGYKKLDTYKMVKRLFGFTSNSLEHLAKTLKLKHQKSKHGKFHGFELWKECLGGNLEAWREMEKYNKQDVLVLEDLYNRIRSWDNTFNPNLYHDATQNMCTCGSTEFRKNGFSYTSKGKFQRYECVKCGRETRDSKDLFSKEKKASIQVSSTGKS